MASFVEVDVLLDRHDQCRVLGGLSLRKLADLERTDPDYPQPIGLAGHKLVTASSMARYLDILKTRGYQAPPPVPRQKGAKRSKSPGADVPGQSSTRRES